MKRIILPALAATLLGSAAYSADLPAITPARAPAPLNLPMFSWTGFYLGGQLGHAWGKSDFTCLTAGGLVCGRAASRPQGVFGGLHAGYNWQNGALVVGLEADAELSGAKGSWSGFGARIDTKEDFRGSLRARAGFALDRALLFVTAGAALSNQKNTYIVPPAVYSVSSTRLGWTLGAGVQYAITDNWSGRLEYRYADFGKVSDSGFPAAFAPAATVRATYSDQALRAGASYKF